jgi:hypothetical protein
MRAAAGLLFLVGIGSNLMIASSASAFCRSTTCREAPQCVEDIPDQPRSKCRGMWQMR